MVFGVAGGNTTCGHPRTAASKFFDQSWLDFVKTTPHVRCTSPLSRLVETCALSPEDALALGFAVGYLAGWIPNSTFMT